MNRFLIAMLSMAIAVPALAQTSVQGTIGNIPVTITLPAGTGTGGTGLSAYQVWLAQPANAGKSVAQFLASLQGTPGVTGPAGATGATGPAGATGATGPQGPAGSGGGGGGGLPQPTTQAAWVAAVQSGLDNCYVATFDPATNITISTPVTFLAKDCGQNPRGLNGNGMTITSTVPGGADTITLTTQPNQAARGLVFGNFHVFQGSGNCLVIKAPANFAIYKGTFSNIYVDNCGKNGIAVYGDVFESLFDNINAENNVGDGMFVDSAGGGVTGVISNLMIRSPNLSRNQGYGYHSGNAPSTDIIQGSFINNWLGGLLGENGIRTVDSVNCENTGLICVSLPWSNYPSRIIGVNLSSEGSTKGPSPNSLPSRYTFLYHGPAGNLLQFQNYFVYYGSGTSQMALQAP